MENKISEAAAARLINVAPGTLLNWRNSGILPTELFHEQNYATGVKRIKYKQKEFLEWADHESLTAPVTNGM